MLEKGTYYLDQNMLFYAEEENFDFPISNNIIWVYSNEHFNEIERQGNIKFLKVLNDIKAKYIEVKLDKNFKITENAMIHENKDSHILYNSYLESISEIPVFNLSPLLSFFYGNISAIEPAEYIKNFKDSLIKIQDLIYNEIKDTELMKQYNEIFEKDTNEFDKSIIEASKSIGPLKEMRKKLTDKQCSDLDIKNGKIINQIWDRLNVDNVISKDIFFGKEPYSFQEIDKIPTFLGISQCYSALNFIGYWPDEGLSKLSKIYGINSDASHVGHAAFCSALVSGDDRMLKKAEAIYDYFQIRTKLYKYLDKENIIVPFGN
ncbi:MAG: hypothetical protein OEZ22_14925 [Spirochaetia bacterium]|nr:hypothetical protein [Spirochaetia bacterium]